MQAENSSVRRARQLAAILRASEAFKAGLSLDHTLSQIASSVRDAVGFNIALLSLVEGREERVFRRVAYAGLAPDVFKKMAEQTTPVEKLQIVLRDEFRIKNSFFIPHTRKQVWKGVLTTHSSELGAWSENEWHPEDMLLVPIMGSNGKLLGLLSVDDPANRKLPSEEDIELLEVFANQAAVAIENAQLFAQTNDELEHRIAELEALREIDRALLDSSLDLEGVIDIILGKSLQLIGAQYGNLMLVEDKKLVIQSTTTRPKEKEVGRQLSIDDSISGLVVTTGQPMIVPDVDKEPLYQRVLQDEYMRSELAVPLKTDDRVIGVLNVESPQAHAFTKHHKDLLITLAGQAALAIRNARHTTELEALREIDRALLDSSLDLDGVLDIILGKSLQLIGAQYGNLMLVEDKKLVIQSTTTRPKEKEVGRQLSIDDSISGLVITTGQPVIVPDVDKEPLYQRVLQDEYMRSELAVPLKTDDRVIGVLNVESPQAHAFTKHHKDMLITLAGQATIAIRNAQLFEELWLKENIQTIADTAVALTHEIRQKAYIVQLNVESLMSELHDANASIHEDLQRVYANTRRIMDVINDLLNPLKKSNLEPVKILDVLRNSLTQEHLSGFVSLELPQDEIPLVRADSVQLNIVFGNILRNALDAMEQIVDKRIWVSVDIGEDRKHVEVHIIDNGPGIPPGDIDRIWLPGMTSKPKGLGLGLYACAQICQNMGCKIVVRNEIGKGARFTVSIPIGDASHNA